MSRSIDPDHFFQTNTSLEQSKRKALKSTNTNGSPIRLPSKVLALLPDPTSPTHVFVAESAGTVRHLNLETHSTTSIYTTTPVTTPSSSTPTSTPLTSLALSPTTSTLYAGSWDTTIHSWHLSTRHPSTRFRRGHSDFVKTLLVTHHLQGSPLLLSGSADATIVIWHASTGSKLHTLKGHARGVLSLALDPLPDPSGDPTTSLTLFSACSVGEIRRWRITTTAGSGITAQEVYADSPIRVHETSVFRLLFDSDGDLWSASADGTVKGLVRGEAGGAWEVQDSLTHGDWVRDVCVTERWVVTGGREEGVRVWDRGTGKLHHTFTGHFDEITSLAAVGSKIVSAAIDGTVRQWSLEAGDLRRAVEEAEAEAGADPKGEVEGRGGEGRGEGKKEETLMTEEEERELVELMGGEE
ncbi:hypothetical protein MMC20_006127 [Loxospora ochrophaea]|nr:hypothetical protein [Loxospora ochrophaea]